MCTLVAFSEKPLRKVLQLSLLVYVYISLFISLDMVSSRRDVVLIRSLLDVSITFQMLLL